MVGKIRITWAVRQISLRLAEPRHVKKNFEGRVNSRSESSSSGLYQKRGSFKAG